MTVLPPPSNAPAFRARLLEWFKIRKRALPWRETPDPYRIWVSEIMLQQTTVKAVIPYYEAFLSVFPTVEALAGSSLDEVLARWSGLGYYTRARNLHAAARSVLQDHQGRFPQRIEEALALPGVGAYTAAAILSIAYGVPAAVLDGNVARVLSRVRKVGGDLKSGAVMSRLRTLAGELLDPESPGDHNQAMMELGATVCTPRSPACGDCPVSRECWAFRDGVVPDYPVPRVSAETRKETLAVAVLMRGRAVLLQQRHEGAGPMPGLWELPGLSLPSRRGNTPRTREDLETWLRSDVHPTARVTEYAGEARHAIMNRRIRVLVFRGGLGNGVGPGKDRRWVEPETLGSFGTSSIVRKAMDVAFGKSVRGRK